MNNIIQTDSNNIDQLLNKVKQQGLGYLGQLPNLILRRLNAYLCWVWGVGI
jgi:hypothetical protein